MRLIVFDVEGTIFEAKYRIDGTEYASTLWQPIALALGEDAVAEELETHRKWSNLEYNNYLEWVEESVEIHRRYGLDKKTFQSLLNEAVYKPGVVNFFKQLDRNEYIPVLVSGGFQELVERAQKDLNIKYGFAACKYIFGSNGKLFGYSLQPSDFKDKLDSIRWLFEHYGLDIRKDWIYVGDGKNDKYIAEKAPISLGIDPHPELERVVDYEISNFSEIIPLIENHDEQSLKKASNKNVEPITRIEKIQKENSDLRKYNKKLQNQLNEFVQTKHDDSCNHIPVLIDDQRNQPVKSLAEILDNCSIVIIGLDSHDHTYQFFSNFHSNLKVIDGFTKSYDPKVIRKADFVFKIIKEMAHTVGYKADKELSKKPHSELLAIRNTDILMNSMANVLCRYFNLVN